MFNKTRQKVFEYTNAFIPLAIRITFTNHSTPVVYCALDFVPLSDERRLVYVAPICDSEQTIPFDSVYFW